MIYAEGCRYRSTPFGVEVGRVTGAPESAARSSALSRTGGSG